MLYKKVISPFLDRRDSETWHVRVREALHCLEESGLGLAAIKFFADQHKRYAHKKLHVSLGGVEFDNPVLVGAGWDKEGRAVRGLWQLGAAGEEVGGVLEYLQPGNEKPRQFMIGRGVCINRLGFNSDGMEVVAKNLERYKNDEIPVGINIGENKWLSKVDPPEPHAEAYAAVARHLYEFASWFTINASSPNTPGLQRLQGKEYLGHIVQEVIRAMEEKGGRKLLLVKISPDISRKVLDGVIEIAAEYGLGIVATNTTSNPDIKAKYGEYWRNQPGGFSGDDPDFRKMSSEKVACIYNATHGAAPIMAVGGIKDWKTGLEKIMAGGSILQVVTALRGEGLSVLGKVNRGLVEFMDKEGVKSIQDLVGIESHRYKMA